MGEKDVWDAGGYAEAVWDGFCAFNWVRDGWGGGLGIGLVMAEVWRGEEAGRGRRIEWGEATTERFGTCCDGYGGVCCHLWIAWVLVLPASGSGWGMVYGYRCCWVVERHFDR